MIEPGRNSPCPCGSGKRYKDCHGALADAQPSRDRDDPPALREMRIWFDMGDIASAEASARMVLRTQPDHPEALRILGRHRLGALDEAHQRLGPT